MPSLSSFSVSGVCQVGNCAHAARPQHSWLSGLATATGPCSIMPCKISHQKTIFDPQQVPDVPIMSSDHTGSADLLTKRQSVRLYPLKHQTNIRVIKLPLVQLCWHKGQTTSIPLYLLEAPLLGYFLGSPHCLSFPILLCHWVLYPWVWASLSWWSVSFDTVLNTQLLSACGCP